MPKTFLLWINKCFGIKIAICLWGSPLVSGKKNRQYLFNAAFQVDHMASKVLFQPILFVSQCGGKVPATATLATRHGTDVWKIQKQKQKWNKKKKPSKISFAWMKNRVYNYHCCKKVNAYFIFSLVWNKMNPNKQKHWCFELISVLWKVTIIRTNSNKAKSGNIKQISFNPIKISLSLRMLEFDLFKWILI